MSIFNSMDKDNGKINVHICIDSNMIEILLSEKARFLVESPYFSNQT